MKDILQQRYADIQPDKTDKPSAQTMSLKLMGFAGLISSPDVVL